ncbi:thioredoxin [bacterium]|nr:thioredoxin [candidate division CSSED10-310 bacterium]
MAPGGRSSAKGESGRLVVKDAPSQADELHAIIEVTDDNLATLIENESKPIVVDFWASWCAPCRILSPVIDELGKDYKGKVIVAKMNVDNNKRTPAQYRIKGIPTVLVFHKGKLVETLTGVRSKSEYRKIIEKLI